MMPPALNPDALTICARCGACLSVCPVYEVTRHERLSPRGKYELIRGGTRGRITAREAGGLFQTISACIQCGGCSSVCPSGVGVDEIVRSRRQEALPSGGLPWWLKAFFKEQEISRRILEALSVVPGTSGLVARLAGLLTTGRAKDVNFPAVASVPALRDPGLLHGGPGGRTRIFLFVGCVQNYLYPEIPRAIARWLGPGAWAPEGQGCCGFPAFSAGDMDLARRLIKKNLQAFRHVQDDTVVVTGCVTCASMIRRWPEVICREDELFPVASRLAERVMEFTEAVVRLKALPGVSLDVPPGPVLLHLPCHQRFGHASRKAPEALMKGLFPGSWQGLEACCGHGGTFALSNPGLSKSIFEKRLRRLEDIRPGTLFTTCSGCLLMWRTMIPVERCRPRVLHPAEMAGGRSGQKERGR